MTTMNSAAVLDVCSYGYNITSQPLDCILLQVGAEGPIGTHSIHSETQTLQSLWYS